MMTDFELGTEYSGRRLNVEIVMMMAFELSYELNPGFRHIRLLCHLRGGAQEIPSRASTHRPA